MKSIQLFAGRKARNFIAEHGLKPKHVKAILGASGGPKWFVLSHLDRYLCTHFLPEISDTIELIGSSIGAWRMAAYASANPAQAISLLEENYLNQHYSAKPTREEITKSVEELLDVYIDFADISKQPHRKLNIVAARCKGLTQYEHSGLQTLAFAGVALTNIVSRKTLPAFFERAVFQSRGANPPLKHWPDFTTQRVELTAENYRAALLASGSIPVVIDGILNPPGAKPGMYRDGGMVDYHFDIPLRPNDGVVLYPHFTPELKPGWFDKPLKSRKVQAANYSHTLVITPSKEFIESLPNKKIPDRKDFEHFDTNTRIQYWNKVVEQNQLLRDEFHDWLDQGALVEKILPIETITR